jgi:hypothetical protein
MKTRNETARLERTPTGLLKRLCTEEGSTPHQRDNAQGERKSLRTCLDSCFLFGLSKSSPDDYMRPFATPYAASVSKRGAPRALKDLRPPRRKSASHVRRGSST